jgi:hypothetical protein
MISTATDLNVEYAVKRELLGALQLILESPNIQQAVNVLCDLVTKFDCELLSLEFADIEGVGDIIRPFSGFPKVIREIFGGHETCWRMPVCERSRAATSSLCFKLH